MGNKKSEKSEKGFFQTNIFGNNNKKKFPDIMESIMRENNISSSKLLTNEEKIKINVEFIEAIINKNYDLMIECFSKGADINYKTDIKTPFTKNYHIQGATPIFYAIKNYDEKIFNFLVRNGADVNVKNKDNETPLLFLVEKSKVYDEKDYMELYKSIELLIEQDADIKILNSYGKGVILYALEGCINYKLKELIEMLIKNGANVNEIDSLGTTPLMFAAEHCNIGIIELLRDNGAIMDRVNRQNGYDAIDYAIVHNKIEVVKTLLEIDKFKFQEPLEKTVENGIWRNYRTSYLSHRKEITCNEKGYRLQDGEGETYLMRALRRGNMEIIELILSYLDYEQYLILKNFKSGKNVLHEAVLLNNKEMVELLISKKMNLNEQDGTGSIGYTALMYACSNYDEKAFEIANLLIDAGADVTLINYLKESALSLISKRIMFELNKNWKINPKLIKLNDKLNRKLNEILEYRRTHEQDENFNKEEEDTLPF